MPHPVFIPRISKSTLLVNFSLRVAHFRGFSRLFRDFHIRKLQRCSFSEPSRHFSSIDMRQSYTLTSSLEVGVPDVKKNTHVFKSFKNCLGKFALAPRFFLSHFVPRTTDRLQHGHPSGLHRKTTPHYRWFFLAGIKTIGAMMLPFGCNRSQPIPNILAHIFFFEKWSSQILSR